MKIGLTYDLREEYLAQGFSMEETAEFDKPETVEALESCLQNLGYETEKIGNIFNLTKALAEGKRWDLVFNICEGMYGFAREAQVPAILEAYKIPCTFSDPMVLSLSLHKGMTKHVVRSCGVSTPDFAMVEEISDVDRISLPFPLFAKPAAEGTSKGVTPISRINSQSELRSTCRVLLKKYRQPVIVETFLPGREFTVGIIGTGKKASVIGAMEVVLTSKAEAGIYSYHNKENYQGLVEYYPCSDEQAKAAMDVALKSWQAIGGRDVGRVDIRCDAAGMPNFIEVNPLPGMNPVVSDLPILARLHGMDYQTLVGKIMSAVIHRMGVLPFIRQKKNIRKKSVSAISAGTGTQAAGPAVL